MMQVAGEPGGLELLWGRDVPAVPDASWAGSKVKEAGWSSGWFLKMRTTAFEKGPQKINVK